MYLVTADEMQRMDRMTIETVGIPGRVLMENAGRGATAFFLEAIHRHHPGPVGIAAGRGNNGGDGFVMARYLHQKGIPVTVFLFSDRARITADAAANLELLDAMNVPVIDIPDEDALASHEDHLGRMHTWIDAILGTGLASDVRGFFKSVIAFINRQDRPVFAVDIASGLNADTGQICGSCIQASATATFGFAKAGHAIYPGRSLSGRLQVVEIGIPPHVAATVGCRQHLITPGHLRTLIPSRSAAGHKGHTGHLLVLAGAPGKTGAAAMTATAAMRSGAGLVTLGIPKSLNPVLETMVTEAMTAALPEIETGALDDTAFDPIVSLLSGKRCLAIGPGIGTADATGRLLERLFDVVTIPMVIDADAINLVASDPSLLNRCRAPVVLTPHPGEMARLCGQTSATVQGDRIGHARRFARKYRVYLVLKGAATIVALPDGIVFVNTTGNPGMAAGGMGDVLTGMIGALIAQGMDAGMAACAGVHLHGLAADRLSRRKGTVGFLATEVMNTIPEAMQELMDSGDHLSWPELDSLSYPTDPNSR